jgi:outer membrane lipopolysaccharide assembly protein LptE/RlpB
MKEFLPIRKTILRVTALFLVILLCACGFHPRMQNVLPRQFCAIYLESVTPYGDFESVLRRSLAAIGVQVMRCPQAEITLHIISLSIYHDPPTIGGSSQARVYNFYYQVTFAVRDRRNNVILAPQTVTSNATLIMNPGEALESTNQLKVLKYEMQREASHMIINHLNSACMFAKLGHC